MEINKNQTAVEQDPYNLDYIENKEGENDQNAQDQQKKKVIKKKLYKFGTETLIDKPNGLIKLYQYFVSENTDEKSLEFKGKGHELSDLKKVMSIYKNWHYEACPKFEFSFFIERL